jgi:hypothetical protein
LERRGLSEFTFLSEERVDVGIGLVEKPRLGVHQLVGVFFIKN